MTVLENMLVAVRRTRVRELLAGARNPEEIDKARALLVRVGIDHLENAEARNLSYGQQKLLELAGVLMGDPDTIMLDEPAGGVNPALIGRIGTLVQELNAEGKTFLVVEHNMDMVMSLSHHVIVFDRGRPIAEGTPPSCKPTRECWRPTLVSDPTPGRGRSRSTSSSWTTSRPATAAPRWCCAG